jgi:hypothetical protein
MQSHRWEQDSQSRHRWEASTGSGDPAPGGPAPDEPDDESDVDCSATPGDDFVEGMLDLLSERTLNARQFCEQMFHAGRAGINEAIPFGKAPGAPSGHYNRHVKDVFCAFRGEDIIDICVPGHGKHSLSRTLHKVAVLVPHEMVGETMVEASFRTRLIELLDSRQLPPAYYEHSVVRGNPNSRVAPFALYIDGVAYAITDTVIGYWLVCLTTNKRHLFAVLRKKLLCECGCRGWCTHDAMFRYIHWSLLALAKGEYPSSRPDKQPWLENDRERMLLANSALPFIAAVIHIKGDWAEYAGTLGFPSWQDGLRPCFQCPAFGADMFSALGHTCVALAWLQNDEGEYEAACQRCEVRVRLDADSKAIVLALLRPDKRKDRGAHGLALVAPVPALGLHADDRLEPSPNLPDVGALADADVPIDVVFWRTAEETLTRHRNPLFCTDLGLSPKHSLTIDELHANNLGVMNVYCKIVVWFVLLSGTYGHLGNRDENIAAAVLGFRHDLMAWYKTTDATVTQVSDFRVKMVGTQGEPKCKTKGAETWGLMLFLLSLLTRHANSLGARGATYLAAGHALKHVVDTFRSCGMLVPPEAQQEPWE